MQADNISLSLAVTVRYIAPTIHDEIRMCTSSIFRRMAAVAMIMAGCVFSASSQTITNSDQASRVVELLNNVKTAVQTGRYANPTEVYKIVSIRLAVCAVVYGMLSKDPNVEQSKRTGYTMASNVMYRASTAIFPGTTASFKESLLKARDELLQIRARSDNKAMFYFLRNCKDLTDPMSVEGAVRELLL